ncbi:MAG: OmpA family protein [Paracoccaceae bacterium]|nr:OmpA family protein [Paracoccaceae bacterium]
MKCVCKSSAGYPISALTIIGHTDNVCDASYNCDISNRRAYRVETVLLDAGMSLRRMNACGLGEEQPLVSNLTVQGRAQTAGWK